MTQGDYREFMTVTKATGTPIAPPSPRPRSPRVGKGIRGIAVLAVLFTAVLVAAVVVGMRMRPAPRDDRPVTLPTQFAGVLAGPSNHQFDKADWRESVRSVFGDHPYAGMQYGDIPTGFLVNVVAVREEAPDVSDAGMARPPFTEHGAVQCSHRIEFGAVAGRATSVIDEKFLICYRAGPTLTVSAFVLVGGGATEDVVAQAVDDLWRSLWAGAPS